METCDFNSWHPTLPVKFSLLHSICISRDTEESTLWVVLVDHIAQLLISLTQVWITSLMTFHASSPSRSCLLIRNLVEKLLQEYRCLDLDAMEGRGYGEHIGNVILTLTDRRGKLFAKSN
ncbi:hypothetical protein OPV22_020049 [Ensete ventricosum]|uniref:Uncharacterized protein n=1 Tax=Ensete ventricosum TaxID=4639 RepID=A0AAV8QDP2_ENSVE|nr:hypothetical protein OPV22_020049 [Ensete ventricosum]